METFRNAWTPGLISSAATIQKAFSCSPAHLRGQALFNRTFTYVRTLLVVLSCHDLALPFNIPPPTSRTGCLCARSAVPLICFRSSLTDPGHTCLSDILGRLTSNIEPTLNKTVGLGSNNGGMDDGVPLLISGATNFF